jgi:hypothetical protein
LDDQYQFQALVAQLRDANTGVSQSESIDRPMMMDLYAAAVSASPPPPPGGGSNDLPTQIAEAIAKIYYETLELNVVDIQDVIKNHYGKMWKNKPLILEDIDDNFILHITEASIDKGRMQLRTILPHEDIVKIAVDELKHPPLTLQSFLELMKAVWNKFVELLAGCFGCGPSTSNGPSNP